MDLVTVDIGGTHARFAIARIDVTGTITLGEAYVVRIAEHESFLTAWQRFRSERGGALPASLSLAIAGSIDGDAIRFTNNSWTIPLAAIPREMGIAEHIVVNDFEAVGHAVARMPAGSFHHLAGPDRPLPDNGTISIVGPGTGLGVSHIRRSRDGYHVQATEGGHMAFAPFDAFEDALLARLRMRYDRVSVERAVSGPAITDLYGAIAAQEGSIMGQHGEIAIWSAGLEGSDPIAVAAVDRFCLLLGSVAGDIALAQGGFGGVVIAGGLGERLRNHLKNGGFADRFTAKGRFSQLMQTVPVKMIDHPEPGLFGAAAAFARHRRKRG